MLNKRPVFHFTSEEGYLGDPNGLSYLDGKYHLFYQNKTDFSEEIWGPFHWCHAVGEDLLHWEYKGLAVPDTDKISAYSGSCLIDKKNVTGLKVNADPMLLFWTEVDKYTSETFALRMSYSVDGGETFSVHPKKLIEVPHDKDKIWGDRDPMCFYHEESDKYILLFYGEYYSKNNMPALVLYSSKDLFNWTYESQIDNMFECADMFKLRVKGTEEYKWVVTDAPGEYMVGDFDGSVFTPCQKKNIRQKIYPDYAAQTWKLKDRVVQTSMFIQPKIEGENWQQCFTLPVELGLRKTNGVYELTKTPIEHKKELVYSAENIMTEDINKAEWDNLDACEIDIECSWHQWTMLWIGTKSGTCNIDFLRNMFTVGQSVEMPYRDKIALKIFVDKNILEVFMDEGTFYGLKAGEKGKNKFTVKTFTDRNVLIDSIKIYKIIN